MAKSKWDMVEPKIPLIKNWRRIDGLTEKEVAKKLGISVATLETYKNKHPEFLEVLKESKEYIVSDIFQSLLKRAKGYDYEEKKTYTRIEEDKTVTYVEITKKHEAPNVAACSLALKNIDKDRGWSDNPGMLAIKKQESELRKMIVEKEEW